MKNRVIQKTSARLALGLIFSADFAAQRTRYPQDFLFLPSLKRAPGAVSLCGFPTPADGKKRKSLGARLMR
jgi:hypothetical protein